MFDLGRESADLAAMDLIDWERLSGRTVFVSGATGLIGSHCVRVLLERNKSFGSNIKVVALVRDEERGKAAFEGYGEVDGLRFLVADLLCLAGLELRVDFIIHAGCPTASDFFMGHPVETSRSIVEGTLNMLEIARCCAAPMVYVSSMEVYGSGNQDRGLERKLDESAVGYVDPLNVRSCYPEGKRMAENYCCSYASEYGVPVAIARLAQTFGPGIPKEDRRVFTMLARCAMSGEDIVLRTTGESTRMYSYTTDAVAAIFAVLLKGEPGCAYNVANEGTYCSVREMAEMVAQEFSDGRTSVVVDVDPDAPYPPEHHLPLDTRALCALGWSPRYDLRDMFENLIDYLG